MNLLFIFIGQEPMRSLYPKPGVFHYDNQVWMNAVILVILILFLILKRMLSNVNEVKFPLNPNCFPEMIFKINILNTVEILVS